MDLDEDLVPKVFSQISSRHLSSALTSSISDWRGMEKGKREGDGEGGWEMSERRSRECRRSSCATRRSSAA